MSTEKLVKELANKIDQLNRGELELDELNDLVNKGKDLYEQLVVLRYKAFDKYGEPDSTEEEAVATPSAKTVPEPPVTETPDTETAAFDFTNIEDPVVEEESQPIFDFTTDEEETEKPEEKTPVTPEEEEDLNIEEEEGSNSLNDALKKEDDLSLRKKLQNSPIADIKTHISIAKKFEYISNMFDGDSNAYDEAIDFLNTCATGKDAQLKLNEYTTTYDWDLEDKSIIKFIELVERRYL